MLRAICCEHPDCSECSSDLEREYLIDWLGILAEAPPSSHELTISAKRAALPSSTNMDSPSPNAELALHEMRKLFH